jgi:peptidyl-prolyl cis-trans isomerase C
VTRVLPLVAALVLCACSKGTPAAANTAASATPAAAAPAPAAQQQPDAAAPAKPVPAQLPDVVARVNGETISKGDLDEAVKELEANAGQPVPAEQRDRVFRGMLDQLIGYRLLVQETKARKTAVPDTDVEARIAQIQKQFPTEEAFKQVLEQRSLTLQKLRDDVRDDLLVSKMLDAEIGSKVTVSPDQINTFYQQNPTRFQQGERVRASHILIRVPENADAAAKDQARAKANDLLKEVKAGKDFAALAKDNSQDPGSAVKGGDLGFFEHGQMVPPFDQAAFSLGAGQVSELVETQFGFHIIKVVEKQASRTVPIDDVRPQIQQFLENQNRQEQTRAFVDTLKAKGKVEIFI